MKLLKEKNNVVLVGFMGTGKSETAKHLASSLSMEYVSTDDEIESSEGMTISDIFLGKGESYFREAEKKIIKKLSSKKGLVIDCGGGVVLDAGNMEILGSTGVIFCLWADPEEIFRRVKDQSHRPLLNVDDPVSRIMKLLDERRECYKKADFHIDTTYKGPMKTTEEIRRILDAR